MKNIVITGSESGLGRLLAEQFEKDQGDWTVHGLDRHNCNLLYETSIKRATQQLPHRVDVLINCAGVNKVDFLEDLTLAVWEETLAVNTRAPWLLTKFLLPALKAAGGTVCNVISNASHIPMTASLAYNASKAALHMVTLQLARELTKRHGITVFGISPNKMAGTGMSEDIEQQVQRVRGWTPEYAQQYQLNALVTGKETDPHQVARFMFWLLSEKERHEALSGCVLPYGA